MKVKNLNATCNQSLWVLSGVSIRTHNSIQMYKDNLSNDDPPPVTEDVLTNLRHKGLLRLLPLLFQHLHF